ncbi:GH25 family lysozyme [Brachybacterium sp. J153]|uniref:GH25 family lysozyme n=1 Tax=Brachybacterium sp. J153 TaxID=3116488 RepID=UPI002E7A7F40|nr:GH25 family lysozyme [Brachybacterium sp. J153]MEE1617442.1 GH25 family lysozyme [Brachybacterium sp. J153]
MASLRLSSYRPKHLAEPPGSSTDPGRRSLLRGGVLSAAALGVGASALAAPAAQAAGIHGQDVSGWQGEVDWAAQAAAGSRFAWVKATEGRTYRSPAFDHQYRGAGDAGLVRGGYHFARPDSGGPEEQVDFFLANGGGWSDDGRTLPGMVDFEGYEGLPADYGLGQQEMREWIATFSSRYREATTRRPVIYTNYYWWRDVVGDWTPKNSPLFLAAYQDAAPTRLPGRWWAWELWQYSDSGPFAGDSVRWYGGEDSFARFVGEKDYGAEGI